MSTQLLGPYIKQADLSHESPLSSHFLNPLTPMSDQDRISPYYIYTTSFRQVVRIKNINHSLNYQLIRYQILQTNTMRIIWQTVRGITNEILGVQGLNNQDTKSHFYCQLGFIFNFLSFN